ncbi:hypothetical protein CSKR_108878 [Clonorchis sinensis]|uniref:Uncharacterized protein n=1 Tax=Clonorchis sinensis TaxID=79923 RepID=A0A3R7C624_CLOSI|nr:hypothetical protein CSKR_108878 [Clonorchis sinensis]
MESSLILHFPRNCASGIDKKALQSSTEIFREIHSSANQFGFCERLTWNPTESLVCDDFRQLNEPQEGRNRSWAVEEFSATL